MGGRRKSDDLYSGFVFFYLQEQSLYYDANTGIYFFYNPESKKYEFHSQIDVSQLKESQNTLDENVEEVEECKPTSKHRKTKKHKDTTEVS